MKLVGARTDDTVFDALTRLGFEVQDHSSHIASSIMSDAKEGVARRVRS